MKNAKNISLLLIAVVFSITSVTAQSAVKKELTEQINTFYEGFNEQDVKKLINVYDNSAVLASHSMLLNEGHDQIEETFTGLFGVNPSIDHKITKITNEGDLAIVIGEFQFRGTFDGNSFAVTILFGF